MPTASPRPSYAQHSPSAGHAPAVAEGTLGLARGLAAMVPELRARAMRLSGDASVADDLAQDAVVRALRFSAQYVRGTNLRAWVHQILFSVFVTRYRRARRERSALRVLASDPHAWTLPEPFASSEAQAPLTPRTRAHLDALPDGYRAVVVLVDLQERSYREAASELGLPVGTVMSRLHRGRKLLAARLAPPKEPAEAA
jgi:RNA polymerase sigma-70 factor (ECF subfamily)